MKEGTSGKSKEEVWCRFCYLYWCSTRDDFTPEEVTPQDFEVAKIEQKKWVYSFKYMGPPCEFLELGECKCHEFLSHPAKLDSRGTSTEKRKADGNPEH